MKKMNKKGFTLIEMLVVIAIIAVLVSIIIPTVNSATTKANAAANAANLRSIYAEAMVDSFSTTGDTEGFVHLTVAEDGTRSYTADTSAPKAKVVKISGVECTPEGSTLSIKEDPTTRQVTVKYGEYTIEQFAKIAETGKLN